MIVLSFLPLSQSMKSFALPRPSPPPSPPRHRHRHRRRHRRRLYCLYCSGGSEERRNQKLCWSQGVGSGPPPAELGGYSCIYYALKIGIPIRTLWWIFSAPRQKSHIDRRRGTSRATAQLLGPSAWARAAVKCLPNFSYPCQATLDYPVLLHALRPESTRR